jgi:hypothetical protein
MNDKEPLAHYFLTYKAMPGDPKSNITVDPVYDAAAARAVILAARADHRRHFSGGLPS